MSVRFLQGRVPFAGKGRLASGIPVGGGVEVIVGGEDAKMVEVVSCVVEAAIGVFEQPKVVDGDDSFEDKLKVILDATISLTAVGRTYMVRYWTLGLFSSSRACTTSRSSMTSSTAWASC